MNYLDYIICVPLLWGAYKGFSNGLLFEIALLLALILGVYGAMKFSGAAGNYLHDHFHFSENTLPFISFLFVFAIIVIVILLGAKLMEMMINVTPVGIMNKIGGSLFGLLKWAFVVSAIFYILLPFDAQFHLLNEKTKDDSILYNPISKFAMVVMPVVKEKMSTHILPANKKADHNEQEQTQ